MPKPHENASDKPAPHKHKWKHYPGALGYETFKCSICGVDQADIRSNITVEDLNKLEEHAALNAIVNEIISIREDEASLNSERDDRGEKRIDVDRFYKMQIEAAKERLEQALANLDAVRRAH